MPVINVNNMWQILRATNFLKNNLPIEQITSVVPAPKIVNRLYEAYQNEVKLESLLPAIIDRLVKYSHEAKADFVESLANSGLDENTQNQAAQIFQETLLADTQKAAENFSNSSLRRTVGTVSEFVLGNSLKITEGILRFKNAIDSQFPGRPTDIILDLAAPAIISAISVCSGPVAIALETSGILSKISGLFKTRNLEKIANFCQEKLDNIKKDKFLVKNQLLAEKLTDIGQKLDIEPISLCRAGFNFSNDKVNIAKTDLGITEFQEISPKQRQFFQDLVNFSDNSLFALREEATKFVNEINLAVVEELTKNNFSPELINDFKVIFEKDTQEALMKMQASSDINKPLFERVALADQSYNLLQKSSIKHLATLSKKHNITAQDEQANLGKSLKIMQDKINQVQKVRTRNKYIVTSHLNKNEQARNFAKSHLGYQAKNDIVREKFTTIASKPRPNVSR